MKLPLLDLSKRIINNYLGKVRFVNRFIRYWGTTTVDGVEVLNDEIQYFPSYTEDGEKLLKHLGIFEDIEQAEFGGIKKAVLYLNGTKDTVKDMTSSVLVNYLNEIDLDDGNEITGTILFTGRYNKPLSDLVTESLSDKPALIQEIQDKFEDIWGNYEVSSDRDGDPYLDTLLRYILRTSDIAYEIKDVSISFITETLPRTKTLGLIPHKDATVIVQSFRVDIKIPDVVFNSSDSIIDTIKNDLQSTSDSANTAMTRSALGRVYYNPVNEDTEDDDYSYLYTSAPDPVPSNPSLWYKYDDRYYLRLSTLKGKTIKLDEKIDLITDSIDSIYKKKKVSWWKKVLVVLAFTVVAYFTAGAGIVGISQGILVASLTLTLSTLLLQQWGDDVGARFAGEFSKRIRPITVIATIVVAVGAVYSGFANFARKGATEALKAAGAEATKEAVADYVATNFWTATWQGFKLTVTNPSVVFKQSFTIVSKTSELYYKNELKKISDDIKSKQKQIDEYNESQEASLYRDLAQDFAKMYTNLDARLSSDYEFDRPYEPVKGPYHTGNIQATTVSAWNFRRNYENMV